MTRLLLPLVLIITALSMPKAWAGYLPDNKLTPGVDNPLVTQDNIKSTICVSGWTKTVRPSTSYTNKIKKQKMIEQGLQGQKMSDFELDHDKSIEDGGSPTDPKNLWNELWYLNINGYDLGAHTKDAAENATKKAICAGKITLNEGRNQLAKDWTVLYLRFVNKQFPKYVDH